MKLLLLGKNGQVGWELQRSLALLGEVIALGQEDTDPTLCGNLTLPDQLRATVRHIKPHAVVNAAAYTAVDKAESEPKLAHQVNALGPAILAEEANNLGAWLVHYSTDYVFNGSGTQPWQEDDRTDPLNMYGHSKLAGEHAIRETGCRHLIFRTSWVYAARGNNFAKTMLRLAQERNSLKVINDQIGAPTGADLIADITAHAIYQALKQQKQINTGESRSNSNTENTRHSKLSGTYHLAASGETTWFGYAHCLLTLARERGLVLKTKPERLEPVSSSAFPTPAQRPHNSRLNTSKLQASFGLRLPPWQQGVERLLEECITPKL